MVREKKITSSDILCRMNNPPSDKSALLPKWQSLLQVPGSPINLWNRRKSRKPLPNANSKEKKKPTYIYIIYIKEYIYYIYILYIIKRCRVLF